MSTSRHVVPAGAVPYDVLPGDPQSPVILHVPHAAAGISDHVRPAIVLDDEALDRELLNMTDLHTDRMALQAAAGADRRPWIFVNRLSRLVVDPERFPDEREEMLQVGMGAVYTRTSVGTVLRQPSPLQEAHLIRTYFEPYTTAMARLVADRLDRCRTALILDVHSYASQPLPYELHSDLRRPRLCVGQDGFHTPASLVHAARTAFRGLGEALVNEPFAGAYVPTRHYGRVAQVQALMLEVRRDTYMDERTGEALAGLRDVTSSLTQLIDSLDVQRQRR